MTPDELRKLAGEATPGPWIIDDPGIDGEGGIGAILMCPTAIDERGHPTEYDDFIETDGGCYGPRLRNARLIVLAPDLARLCADLGEALDILSRELSTRYANDALAKLAELETPQ